MEKKRCSKCGIEKEIEYFYKDKNTKDGLYSSCKNCCKIRERNYHQNNKEQRIKKSTQWNNLHKEYRKEYCKKWREKYPNYKTEYEKKRKSEDVFYKFISNIRGLLRKSFKKQGYTKRSHTFDIVGLSYNDLHKYLFENAKLRYPEFQENEFLEKNKYHIDHIIPLSTAKTEGDIINLCHYTNLQLLTKEDNLSKHDSLDWS